VNFARADLDDVNGRRPSDIQNGKTCFNLWTLSKMRKIRNPRYAPEFLERKLFPTALIGGLATIAVVSPPTDPPPPPPDSGPVIPLGPAGPAITYTTCTATY
jgi:hypothetical protein